MGQNGTIIFLYCSNNLLVVECSAVLQQTTALINLIAGPSIPAWTKCYSPQSPGADEMGTVLPLRGYPFSLEKPVLLTGVWGDPKNPGEIQTFSTGLVFSAERPESVGGPRPGVLLSPALDTARWPRCADRTTNTTTFKFQGNTCLKKVSAEPFP